MDIESQIRSLANRMGSQLDKIKTEEATKNSLIMPFIAALGYNVFDPDELTPELNADIGTKKGEKVDYAIMIGGKPAILIECKPVNTHLKLDHTSQLFRYFSVTEARFAILTNGIIYQFFADLDQANKMDSKPFFVFNLLSYETNELTELTKYSKQAFNVDTILATANELKYTTTIQALLESWFSEPPEELLRLLNREVISGKNLTQQVKDQLSRLTKKAFNQIINDRIKDSLKDALAGIDKKVPQSEPAIEPEVKSETKEVETNPSEWGGFYAVKMILRDTVSPDKIHLRDGLSYCAILFDNNNRKPICRLYFNNEAKLTIGLFDGETEDKQKINSVEDIDQFAKRLKDTVRKYLNTNPLD